MTTSTTLERDLFVPRELVFDAWTEPEQVTAWYPPDAAEAPGARIDASPEGVFEVNWRDAEGRRAVASGRFVTLDPPTRLQLDVAEPGARSTQRVTLELVERDGAGAVRLTLEGGRGSAAAGRDEAGNETLWQARLERLERYFSVI